MEKSQILEKLKARTPIFATKNLLPFDPIGKPGLYDSELIQISNYSLFEHREGYAIIYYEWGEPYIDYSTYTTDDYNITWGFSPEALIQHRIDFQTRLETTPTETLLSYLWDPSTNFDERFRYDVCAILSKRINPPKGDQTNE